MAGVSHTMNTSKLGRDLGIARASRSSVRKPDALDEEGKRQIAAVLIEHPRYGHKRIALHLKLGHKRSRI